MNRYYTETIPADLARALKAKGMPLELTTDSLDCVTIMEDSYFAWLDIELGQKPEKVERHYKRPKFGEAFDWFLNSRIEITVMEMFTGIFIGYLSKNTDEVFKSEQFGNWYKAAIAAINKALELI